MSYRDWGSGEGVPPERQPIAPWQEPGKPLPADGSWSGYLTPSRRRAIERGQDEPADTYLPRWATESGVRRADGEGRHAAPDDGVDAGAPYQGGGWRPEPRAIGGGSVSEHTAEWSVDSPHGQRYVGSRRAETDADEPGPGPGPRGLPRRVPTDRPQVTWSGPADARSPSAEVDRWEPGGNGRRARWAGSADAPSGPAVDPRRPGRPRGADPAAQPAVDPWDASGLHAWDRSASADGWTGAGRWERTEHTGEWDRPDTGRWDRYAGAGQGHGSADTGQWDRYAAGQWRGSADTGQWNRYAEVDRWDRTVPPTPVREGWASPEQAEAFWTGPGLAGAGPRWAEPSTVAPRSPVPPYPARRPATAAGWRPAEPPDARLGGPSTLRRPAEVAGGGSANRRLENDLLDPDPGGPLRPLVYTVAWYLVPVLLAFIGLLFLDGQAPAGCVTDTTGGGCYSPREHVLASLVEGAPRFGWALLSSLVVAMVLRLVGTTWRSPTVALAASVVGGGLSTVLISAVTGQPMG